MEHISKSLKKYSKSKQQLVELDKIRAEIYKATGINPVSLKIQNNTVVVKVNNQYEALSIKNNQQLVIDCFTNINSLKVSIII